MKILGLDPGSHFTGFGIVQWQDPRPVHLHHGVFELTSARDLPKKLDLLYRLLNKFFDDHSPQVVAVEKIFLGKNADSAFKLGHVRAIALLVAQQRGCGIAEYAPTTVKKVVTGQGLAEKEHVRRVVFNLLEIESDARHDASDALALALCHGYKMAVELRLKEVAT